MNWLGFLAVLIGLVAVAALASRKRLLAGTTLVAVWWWALASLVVLALAAAWLALGARSPVAASHARYLAGAMTFCPLMALLGAKRPQDRGWQFIVLSLALVLSLPSLESLLYTPDEPLRLHAAWSTFLWILLGLSLFNTLPNSFWPSSLLATAGQTVWLAEQLAGLGGTPSTRVLIAGFAAIAVAVALWAWLPLAKRTGDKSWDRAWRDFRNGFGALWALRVAERFNAAALQYDWPVRLRWRGFVGEGTPALTPAMQTALAGLLRRFVSPEWLAERVDAGPIIAGD